MAPSQCGERLLSVAGCVICRDPKLPATGRGVAGCGADEQARAQAVRGRGGGGGWGDNVGGRGLKIAQQTLAFVNPELWTPALGFDVEGGQLCQAELLEHLASATDGTRLRSIRKRERRRRVGEHIETEKWSLRSRHPKAFEKVPVRDAGCGRAWRLSQSNTHVVRASVASIAEQHT